MESSLSIISLIEQASLTVKLVMAMLVLASFVSWVMIFQKVLVIRGAQKRMQDFSDRFWSGTDLGQLYREAVNAPDKDSGLENIFRTGFKEYSRLRQSTSDPDAVMEGTHRVMRVILAREEEQLESSLSNLATIGSTSPYVGLFGTVWGIMNSFRELAVMKQATIATVAPGISEALVATAMGLFAAIPAVIAYNRFSSRVERIMGEYDNFADEFSSILHRRAHAS